MAQSVTLPAGWTTIHDRHVYDTHMDREYTRLRYDHADSGTRVFVNEVQEPNKFGGWGYLVHAHGPDGGELGLVEDRDAAEGIAMEFMRAHEGCGSAVR